LGENLRLLRLLAIPTKVGNNATVIDVTSIKVVFSLSLEAEKNVIGVQGAVFRSGLFSCKDYLFTFKFGVAA